MGIFSKLFQKTSHDNYVKTSHVANTKYDYPIQSWQKHFIINDIHTLNALLLTNEYTKKLHLDDKNIWSNSYIRYIPFTEKTQKISKYPCMIYVCEANYGGYTATIFYDCKDIICKGNINISGKTTYSIEYKRKDGLLTIMKVLISDKNGNYEKVYHLQKDGSIISK